MDIETEVAWADLKGAVGLRFRNVPADAQQLLEKWLNDRMPKAIAGSKERTGSSSDIIQ
jgi:hypothetical protein